MKRSRHPSKRPPLAWLATSAALIAAVATTARQARAVQPLRAFIESAHDHNVDRREDAATADERESDLVTARRGLLPVLSAKGVYAWNQYEAQVTLPTGSSKTTAVITPQNEWDGYLTATVPLVDLSSWENIHSASLNQRAAVARLAATTVDVDKQVARAFYDVLINRALLDSSQHVLATDEANLKEILVKKAVGTAEELDVERARASVESSKQSVANADYNVALSERRLRTLSGLAPTPGGAMTEDDLHEEPALETFQGTATPKQLAAQLDEDAQRAAAGQTARRLLPTLSATGQERVTNATGFANQSAYFTAMVTLNWNLDASVLSQTEAQRAAARVMAARAARTTQDKDDDVYSSYMLVRAQIATCRAARANAASTRLAYEIARTRYAAGTAQQIDLLQADRDAFSADVARIQANGDLRYDRIALRLAAGRPAGLQEEP